MGERDGGTQAGRLGMLLNQVLLFGDYQRQVTQAVFTFTGNNLGTTQVTVPVDSAFTTWFGGAGSAQFGSSFLYTQPFTVQGNVSDIASVSVTVSNATGTSAAVGASF